MNTIDGNLLDQTRGILCHQVNCKGVMGAGIAKAIRDKYPKVFTDYRHAYAQGQLQLGNTVFSVINSELVVANLCGQYDYGRSKYKVYTRYDAVEEALVKVAQYQLLTTASGIALPVYIPRGMGCTLAGGEWDKMEALIEAILPKAIIVRYK